jgi:NAD(P)H-dependent flavin oxidoreductase YrpB (nitropropane dioxygenase family)
LPQPDKQADAHGRQDYGERKDRTSDIHRTALRQANDEDTRLTRAFSGRLARAKNNRYIDFQFLPYGQATALNRELQAADLAETLVAGAQSKLGLKQR